jgi:tRNA(fMet)-specific endonuclease VapC
MGQMKYVFDTSILIDWLRTGKTAHSIATVFDNTDDFFYISSVTAFELFSGLSSKKLDEIKKIKHLLGYFEIIDLDWNIGKIAGEIYRDNIKNLQVPDYIIAATALEIDAVVVTLNKKHFEKIPNLLLWES